MILKDTTIHVRRTIVKNKDILKSKTPFYYYHCCKSWTFNRFSHSSRENILTERGNVLSSNGKMNKMSNKLKTIKDFNIDSGNNYRGLGKKIQIEAKSH